MQEWALKNGLDADIQSMTQAEKAMLRYRYVMANTTAAQGDFARTANTWANQIRILKQQFEQLASVIGGAFINALKPLVRALNVAMSYIIAFAQTVSNALGKIFGWKFEISGGGVTMADDLSDDFGSMADNAAGAAGSADDIDSAMASTAKSVEKIQKGLRAFDELKVINLPEDKDTSPSGGKGGAGGGGGGLGGLGGAGGSGGQWVPAETIFENFESEIDTLFKLGEYIRDSLINVMESIDWDSVYEKARGFGKGLADFLNGLFEATNGITLFGEVGKTIAKALNAAIYAALSFGETFDFRQFGANIADGINNFFRNFDFKALAQTLNAWGKGIWDTIKGVLFGNGDIEGLDWSAMFKGLWDFISELDLAGASLLAIFAAPALISAMKNLAGLALNVLKVVSQFSNIAPWFTNLFAKIGAGAGAVIKVIGGIGLVIGGAATAVVNFFKMWKDGWTPLNEILKDIGIAIAAIGAVLLGAAAAPVAIAAAAVAAISTIAITIHDNFDAISNFLSDIGSNINDTIIAAYEFAAEDIKKITDSINEYIIAAYEFAAEDIKAAWIYVSDLFSEICNTVKSVWGTFSEWFNTNVVTPIIEMFTNLRDNLISTWNTVANWFDTNVITPIVQFFQNAATNISTFFTNLWNNIKELWQIAPSWFNDSVITPTVTFFRTGTDNIKEFFSGLWDGIKLIWQSVSKWFEDTVTTPITNIFRTACEQIGGFFTNLQTSIKNGVSGVINGIKTMAQSALNVIINTINKFIQSFNAVSGVAGAITGNNWGNIPTIQAVSFADIPAYAVGGFPEDGLFFANPTELVGRFSNGKTAVANNEQIISGISNGVREANSEQNALLREQNQLLREILDKGFEISSDVVFNSVRSSAKKYEQRTNKPAFGF